MDYNFTSTSVTAIEQVDKKLTKIKDNVLDDIANFIRILNDQKVLQQRSQLDTEVNTMLTDAVKETVLKFTGLMGKVQLILKKYL